MFARTDKKVGTLPTCSRRILSPANFNQSRCRILVFASRRANKFAKWKTGLIRLPTESAFYPKARSKLKVCYLAFLGSLKRSLCAIYIFIIVYIYCRKQAFVENAFLVLIKSDFLKCCMCNVNISFSSDENATCSCYSLF